MPRPLIKLAALLIAAGSLLPAQQAPTVWFTPLPYTQHPVGLFGSVDYLSLFSPSAPWQQAASHVQVFKLYGLDNFSDAELKYLMAGLRERKIALALEWAVLASNTCGQGIEGFGGSMLPLLQRIKALGGTLAYIAMQQPFQWGSLFKGDKACKWTAQQVATNAFVTIKEAKTVFPNVQVGDIMAVPPFRDSSDWAAQYGVWFETWRATSGAPLAFFHVDADWTVPNWQAAVSEVRPVAAKHGIPFGMVYNGFLTDETDPAWMASAESHFLDYEVESLSSAPEQVVFQTWNPNPTHVLPETDPNAFTYLIDRYFRRRTQLTLTSSGKQLSGKLTAGTAGLGGASVEITAQPIIGPGELTTYTLTGPVPVKARGAIVGVRVNGECYNCKGTADLTMYNFSYSENTPGVLSTWDFADGLNGWLLAPGPPVYDPGSAPYGQGLHIIAQPAQSIVLNSRVVPVTPGAQFTLQIAARVSAASVGSGYFTLIWFDAAGQEPSREIAMFEPQTLTVGTATTAGNGTFKLNTTLDPDAYRITARFSGSGALWPAAVKLQRQH